MKRKTAKETLADSFRELAAGKHVDKITVKEITGNCGYSYATFYRHFQDKYDLIAWDYSRIVGSIMDSIGEDGYTWKQTLLDGARYFEAEKEYLANLFLHTTGLDSFLRNMTETNDRHLQKCVMQAMGSQSLDEKTAMYIHLYCHGTVALTCDWALGTYQASAEELAEIFENSLPLPLRKYLYSSPDALSQNQ